MSVLGVNSDLSWLQATDGSGKVYRWQILSRTHSALYLPNKVCQAPPVLCFICIHTTQSTSTQSCRFPLKTAKVRGISII